MRLVVLLINVIASHAEFACKACYPLEYTDIEEGTSGKGSQV